MPRSKEWLACVAIALITLPCAAAPQIDRSGSSDLLGDSLLLDDLNSLIGDSAPPKSPAAAPVKSPHAEGPSWLPNHKELERMRKQGKDGLIPPRAGEDLGESPLVTLRSDMDLAGRLIAKGDADDETEPTQERIVDQLDELIKKMEKQCKNCQNSSSSQQKQQSRRSKPGKPKPGKASGSQANNTPSTRSSTKKPSDKMEKAQADAAEAQRRADVIKRVWGRLPERLREQMLQSTSDEFLPEYRDEIEQYFQRLAEEEE